MMWQITIDGELHAMKIPSEDEYLEILSKCPEFHYKDCLVRKQLANLSYIISGESAQKQTFDANQVLLMCKKEKNGEFNVRMGFGGTFAAGPYYLRPCLVPLDDNGLDVSNEFQKENPDGSIIYAGSLGELAKNSGKTLDHGDFFDIGDSSSAEENLRWLCWGGKMFLCDSCFPVQVDALGDFIGLFEQEEVQVVE